VGTIKVKGNNGTATGKHFFLLGLLFESRAKPPFVVQLRGKGFAAEINAPDGIPRPCGVSRY
jgi:hypothetical protein